MNTNRHQGCGLLAACALLFCPSIVHAGEPAPVAPADSRIAQSSAPQAAPYPAPAAEDPAGPAAPAPTAPAPPASPPPAGSAAPGGPAPAPAGWEGKSAKDRLNQSIRPRETDKITVNLRGDEGDTFYAWLGNGRSTSKATMLIDGEVYEQLCDAPCTAQLPAGRNRIAVARGGSPVAANQDITLYAPTTLTADYSSYAAQRILGALVLVGGSVGALALILTAPECKENPSNPDEPLKCNNTQEYIGFGVGVVGVVAGALLLLKNDELEVAIAPGAPAPAPGPQGSRGAEYFADRLKGLSLSVRF